MFSAVSRRAFSTAAVVRADKTFGEQIKDTVANVASKARHDHLTTWTML